MSSSDDSSLETESMAPNPVGIQTSYGQLQGTGFDSVVNPPLSLKDWSESLIEFTETSGYLLPSAGRNSSSHQQPTEASSLAQKSYHPPYNNLYPSDSHINTVVTCSVVSDYQGTELGTLNDSNVLSAINRPQNLDIHIKQKNENAGGAPSSFDISQSDEAEADKTSHTLNRILTNKELDVKAYVPSRDTGKNMPTHFSPMPTTQLLSSNVQISDTHVKSLQAPGSSTEEGLLQISLRTNPEERRPFLFGAKSAEQDISELLPTTLPMHDIDMLSTYDFDIDTDINVHLNAGVTNPVILQNEPVSDTFPGHDLSGIDPSSSMLSAQTLISTDPRPTSFEGSNYRQTDSGLNYVGLDSQCQETDTFTPTCTHLRLTSGSSTKLFSDFEAEKYLPLDPFTTTVPTNTQSVQSLAIHRQKRQLIRSSSDPIFKNNQNIRASSPSPRFLPKLQHQFSLPVDINHPLPGHLHNSPMHFTSNTSFSSSSCTTFDDAYFQEPEMAYSPSLHAQQTDSTCTSHSSPYDCLDPNSYIPQTQPLVTSDPVNTGSFLLSLAMPEPLLYETSKRPDSLSQLNESAMESNSQFSLQALNVERQQAFHTDNHYIPNTDQFKVWQTDKHPRQSTIDWTSQEDGGTLSRTESTTLATSSKLKMASPSGSRVVSNPFMPNSYFNTITSTTPGFPERRYSCTTLPSPSDMTEMVTKSISSCNLLVSSDNLMLAMAPAAVSSVCETLSSTVTSSSPKNKYSEDVLSAANFPNQYMSPVIKNEVSKTVEDKITPGVSTDLNICLAEPSCSSTSLSSIPLVKLTRSTEPVNPAIRASLRTKLKGKSMKPSMQSKVYNVLDPGNPTDLRRQSFKRSTKGFFGSDPQKKRARTEENSEESSISSTESSDSNQTAALTMRGLYPSTSHRASMKKDVAESKPSGASEASTSAKQYNSDSDKETKRSKEPMDPLVQRERNRLSARACRFKKRKRIETLLAEVKRLEEKQSRIHTEIEKMTVERAELQEMLDNHQPNCKMKKSPSK